MKLFRWWDGDGIKPGLIIDDVWYDASLFGEDYGEVFFESGGMERLKAFAEAKSDLKDLDIMPQLAPPIARPSKIICIGLNYSDHAAETGATLPQEPIVFFKSTTSLVGPNDDLILPKGSEKTDWEVELAVVMGKRATYIDEADAMDYVAGFCLHNDYSERHFQLERGGQWVKGKSCDTFAPLGPFLATPDEVKDVHNLRLWLKVNGRPMQDGSTANMVFKIPFLVSYLSQFMTLLPGDVISTGTPAGVGLGMNPQVYLKKGDVVELGIDGLGSSQQKVVAYQP